MNDTNDKFSSINTSKRLPILFCLDVSPSMGYHEGHQPSSMDLLNSAVANFLKQLKTDSRTKMAAEVAFVTFSSKIEECKPFRPIGSMSIPPIKALPEGGTQMAKAVVQSIRMIEQRVEELRGMGISTYAPFLVLVTDGDPDDADNRQYRAQAVRLVNSHCHSKPGASGIIVPFIIGVGGIANKHTLNEYAGGFAKGYFPIEGSADVSRTRFNQVFQLIGNSTKTSIHLDLNSALNSIKASMNSVLDDLSSE